MQILVLYDGEPLYRESVGIVVRPRSVQQAAGGHEAALRDVALTDYLLGGIDNTGKFMYVDLNSDGKFTKEDIVDFA